MPAIVHPSDVLKLPDSLRRAILAGCVGGRQLSRLAGEAVRLGLPGLGAALCAAAFESEPLNVSWAGVLTRADFPAYLIEPSLLDTARRVRAYTRPLADRAGFESLASGRDPLAILDFLEQEQAGSCNIYCTFHAAAVCLRIRDYARLDAIGREWLPPELASLGARLRGDAALAREDGESAATFYRQALGGLPGPIGLIRLAAALDLCGRTDEALGLRQAALRTAPWHVNLSLRLHDDLSGVAGRRRLPPGRTGVFLYTYNKAEDLDSTLASLADSDIGGARIHVLDNGSSDATPEVVRHWTERLGERMTAERLPLNIGAPAARNWLAASACAADLDCAAYIDDDILLPPYWLSLLGAALDNAPGAGVIGCRIVDMAAPRVLQGAAINLLDPAWSNDPDDPSFFMTDFHRRDLDVGLFDYQGPCASVMGCCHLFSMPILRMVGEFDIRFSPSQYDDLDHDFRSVLAGHPPVYQGRLAVRHGRRSGSLAARDLTGFGNDFANRHKLYGKIGKERGRALYEAALGAVESDFRIKAARLAELTGQA